MMSGKVSSACSTRDPSCFSRLFDCVLFVDSEELQANKIIKTEFNVTQSIGCTSCVRKRDRQTLRQRGNRLGKDTYI